MNDVFDLTVFARSKSTKLAFCLVVVLFAGLAAPEGEAGAAQGPATKVDAAAPPSVLGTGKDGAGKNGAGKNGAAEAEKAKLAKGAAAAEMPLSSLHLVTPLVDRFTPWLPAVDDLAAGQERAWEYRPYRVAVWLCVDGSPQVASNLQNIIVDLNRRSQLIDPSGWNLHIGEAPSQYRWQLFSAFDDDQMPTDFGSVALLESYDKLMVVTMRGDAGSTAIAAREFDLLTQQWGPMQRDVAADASRIAVVAMEGIRRAFMPVCRIERVDVKGADTTIYLQVRARDSSIGLVLNEERAWEVQPISSSPVSIGDQERFLPIVRRFDRDGKLIKIEPIALTFLSKIGVTESGEVKCSFVSSQRAPLAGRKTRLAERLALVIRPPQASTWLYMHTMDETKRPIDGIEVYSARPQDRDRPDLINKPKPEFIGKTDWQGKVEIPPNDDGIRVLTVGRGARGGLMRIPVMPGLYPKIETGIPDDEVSLFAEGILQGFQEEILNQVIQREVFETEILRLLDAEELEKAKAKFREYDSMESLRDVRIRLASEQTALENLKLDSRQRKFISGKFGELQQIITNQATSSRKTDIQAKIQVQSNIPGAVLLK